MGVAGSLTVPSALSGDFFLSILLAPPSAERAESEAPPPYIFTAVSSTQVAAGLTSKGFVCLEASTKLDIRARGAENAEAELENSLTDFTLLLNIVRTFALKTDY